MVSDPFSQAQEAGRPRRSHETPKETDLACKESDDQAKTSDRESHTTEIMANCTVICGDRKWTLDKELLCSNNEWFSAAFEGHFQEAYTGEVVIEDTDPNIVQIVLDTICYINTHWDWSKPADIVEVWKAGDFFGVDQLVYEAERALRQYLDQSAEFLSVNQRNGTKSTHTTDFCPDPVEVNCTSCRKIVGEPRQCAVRNIQPRTVLYLRDRYFGPGNCFHGLCKECHARSGESGPRPLESARTDSLRRVKDQKSGPHFRIQREICALGEALVVATDGTPQGSRIQEMLMKHLCTTHVEMWSGLTICKYLEV